MKKILLSVLMLAGFTGFAQDHVQNGTGFTNNCENFTDNPVTFEFNDWISNDHTGTNYGGWGQDEVGEMNYYVHTTTGVCYAWLDLTTIVDLTANPVLSFNARAITWDGSDTSVTISVKLENGGDIAVESFVVTKTLTGFYIIFDNPTGNMANVKRVTFQIDPSGADVRDFDLRFSNIKAGSLVTSTNDASSLVSSSKLFPNPVSDEANIELNLKSASDVKVTLSDMMGREVMTIAEGSMASLNKAFSVATLQKGVYTVNYSVNGAAAKSELLMVK
jgi:hypothetical protein